MKKTFDCSSKGFQFNMPKIGVKRKFKGKKCGKLKYLYSEYMGDDLGWVDSYRDIEGEKALMNFYKARADFEERNFQHMMGKWNLNYKRLAKK